jgi:hypothetical protein
MHEYVFTAVGVHAKFNITFRSMRPFNIWSCNSNVCVLSTCLFSGKLDANRRVLTSSSYNSAQLLCLIARVCSDNGIVTASK